MTGTLVVNEIYLSLQGESTFAGLPCIFIRLTGCDLRCSYCDTAYAFTEGKKKTLAEVLEKVRELAAPFANSKLKIKNSKLDLHWLLKKLGAENVTSLLVEGGGEVNASFLLGGLAQRAAFFYAPKILGGRDARKGVAGEGAKTLSEVIQLREVEWRKLGEDLFLTARVD